jgi:hypothetical protein
MASDLDVYVADLLAHEGCPAEPTGCYPYLDTKGLVTHGVGEHLSIADFARVPWRSYNDQAALESECEGAYNELLHEGQNRVFPFPASHYAQFTRIRLPKAVALQRCKDRLASEFLPHLRAECERADGSPVDKFDDMPLAVRRVLVDLCWNRGCGGFTAAEWPLLFRYAGNGYYRVASTECITVNHSETHEDAAKRPRNVWRRDLMLSCAGPVTP